MMFTLVLFKKDSYHCSRWHSHPIICFALLTQLKLAWYIMNLRAKKCYFKSWMMTPCCQATQNIFILMLFFLILQHNHSNNWTCLTSVKQSFRRKWRNKGWRNCLWVSLQVSWSASSFTLQAWSPAQLRKLSSWMFLMSHWWRPSKWLITFDPSDYTTQQ